MSTAPLDSELDAAVRLARAGVVRQPWIQDPPEEVAGRVEAELRSGSFGGVVYRPEGVAIGVALWRPHGPLGVDLELCYLEPEHATAARYRAFLAVCRATTGPIAFLQGRLAGLTPDEEARLLEEAGFAPFARSEMRHEGPIPPEGPALPDGGTLRTVLPTDVRALAAIHRAAYRGRFDRYLFLEDEDEARDSERAVAQLFEGRWGAYVPEGTWGAELAGTLVGAVLSTRRPLGILIADVMVDPAHQGHGIGRAVLARTVRSLAAAGLGPVYLNVTEGNAAAIRLYARLGFVRSLGPGVAWYDPRRVRDPP